MVLQRRGQMDYALGGTQQDVPSRKFVCLLTAHGSLTSFLQILAGFKQLFGPQWENQMAAMPVQIQERLRTRYQL
jgi:hypothetical protein